MPTQAKGKPPILPKYRLMQYLDQRSGQWAELPCNYELSQFLNCWNQFSKDGPDTYKTGCKLQLHNLRRCSLTLHNRGNMDRLRMERNSLIFRLRHSFARVRGRF